MITAVGTLEMKAIFIFGLVFTLFILVYSLKKGRIALGGLRASRQEDPLVYWMLWFTIFVPFAALITVFILSFLK